MTRLIWTNHRVVDDKKRPLHSTGPKGRVSASVSVLASAWTRRWIIPAAIVASVFLSAPTHAFTPEDPEVIRMIDRAADYLAKLSDKALAESGHGGEEYHQVICAYAHYKAKHDKSPKLIKRGIDKALSLASELSRDRDGILGSTGSSNKSNYEVAVSIMLLAEVDPKKYAKELGTMRDALYKRQMRGGAFGYYGEDVGDVSQIQYVVLAFWVLDQAGIKVNPEVLADTHAYLMRVQDPNGAWPYRAKDPGPGSKLVTQGTKYMSHSTALAGASSILIAGDYFDMWSKGKGKASALPGLPTAIRLADETARLEMRRVSPVKPDSIVSACDRMNQYRDKTKNLWGSSGTWYYYSLYSLERFESFFEFATNQLNEEPEWYNKGVLELQEGQDSTGGWGSKKGSMSPPPVATAFAILFLTRSTQRAIALAQTGATRGGYGLPKDTTNISVEGGSIKGRPEQASVNDLLGILEEDSSDELEGKTLPEDLKLAADPTTRAAQLDRLERLVRGSSSWQARRVAARTLGQSDEMRVVPALIFALSDQDTSVKRYARDGLRFISRRFDGFGMPDKASENQSRKAQQAWKDWYLTMRPGYIFLDDGF